MKITITLFTHPAIATEKKKKEIYAAQGSLRNLQKLMLKCLVGYRIERNKTKKGVGGGIFGREQNPLRGLKS